MSCWYTLEYSMSMPNTNLLSVLWGIYGGGEGENMPSLSLTSIMFGTLNLHRSL